jgi:hypothetical protein
MPRKRYKPEELVAKLRQADVLVSQGQSLSEAIRQIGVSEVLDRTGGPASRDAAHCRTNRRWHHRHAGCRQIDLSACCRGRSGAHARFQTSRRGTGADASREPAHKLRRGQVRKFRNAIIGGREMMQRVRLGRANQECARPVFTR